MGIDVELVEGVGPVVDRPIATAADVEALRVTDAAEWGAPILEAVRIVRAELDAGARSRRLLRRPVHRRRAISSKGSRAATSCGRSR